MENNATIKATLGDLLGILDAKVMFNIFTDEKTSIKYDYGYSILADRDFLKDYGRRNVIGIIANLGTTNILLEEA